MHTENFLGTIKFLKLSLLSNTDDTTPDFEESEHDYLMIRIWTSGFVISALIIIFYKYVPVCSHPSFTSKYPSAACWTLRYGIHCVKLLEYIYKFKMHTCMHAHTHTHTDGTNLSEQDYYMYLRKKIQISGFAIFFLTCKVLQSNADVKCFWLF